MSLIYQHRSLSLLLLLSFAMCKSEICVYVACMSQGIPAAMQGSGRDKIIRIQLTDMTGKVTWGGLCGPLGVDLPQTQNTHRHLVTDPKIGLIFCLSPSQMKGISTWNTREMSNRHHRLQTTEPIIYSYWAISFDNDTPKRRTDKNWEG